MAEQKLIEQKFLVIIETQRVKDYLFASSVLRETRGASLLLDMLNQQSIKRILERLSGYNKIYLGGGSGRVLFNDAGSADKFASQVRSLYQEKTVNARVSVEVLERKRVKNKDDKEEYESIPAWMARGVRESV